ncbi:hypothetical protein BJV74DRAFT_790728, partial [Russula compacta]
LKDEDIPHRTKAYSLLRGAFDDEYTSLKMNLQLALGCISLTIDLWSNMNLHSFMAVMAHWMERGKNGKLELHAALITFHEVIGNHSGENLGKILMDII